MNSKHNMTLEERRILKKVPNRFGLFQKTIKRRLIVIITALLL